MAPRGRVTNKQFLAADQNMSYDKESLDYTIELLQNVGKGERLSRMVPQLMSIAIANYNNYIVGEAQITGGNGARLLHHMFEPSGPSFNPLKQLWNVVWTSNLASSSGVGGSGRKILVSFAYRDSEELVPLDKAQKKRDAELKDLGKPGFSRHVFHKRAQMIEEGETVKIKVKRAKVLAFGKPGTDILKYAPGPLTRKLGKRAEGEFSARFILWWSTLSPKLLTSLMRKHNARTIRDYKKNIERLSARAERQRKRILSDRTSSSSKARALQTLNRAENEIAAIERSVRRSK